MPAAKLEFHPLANQYALLMGAEYEEFKEGVRRAGKIREPGILYEGKILDGRNRYRAATDLGIPFPTREYDPETDGDDPELFIENANDDRRHEMPSVRKERKAERVRRVVHKRQEGKSIRTIAQEEGVSKSQVERDLESGVPYGTPEPTNGKVTGKDGKAYTATKPKKEREPGEDDDVFDEKDAAKDAKRREKNAPKPKAKDATGRVIPSSLKDLFGDPLLRESIFWLEQTQGEAERMVERLKKKVTNYPFVQVKQLWKELEDVVLNLQCARESLAAGVPYAVCPECEGDCAKCKTCRFGGHLPEWRANELQEQGALS